MSRSTAVTNVGFGVKVLQSALSNAQAPGTPPQGFGILLRTIEAEEAKTLGLDNANGAMVLSVVKDSAAERMQVKSNDVLLAINGIDITSTAKLQELMTRGPIVGQSFLAHCRHPWLFKAEKRPTAIKMD